MPDSAQPRAALRRANEIRLTRARFRREIAAMSRQDAAGRVSALLEDLPPEMDTLAVGDLLGHVRRVGPRLAAKVVSAADGHLDPTRRLGDLTERQRLRVASVLRRTIA